MDEPILIDAIFWLEDLLTADQKTQSLTDIQVEVLSKSWCGLSYAAIAAELGYEPDYIKQVGCHIWQLLSRALGTKVTKSNFKTQLQKRWRDQGIGTDPKHKLPRVLDWGVALDVPHLYGRDRDLKQLKHWVLAENCRFISILGMGGIGKSALSYRLGQNIQDEFEVVIWRSLKSSPPLNQELDALLAQTSTEENSQTQTVDVKLECLIQLLRQRRCLLILDNFDVLLETQQKCGQLQPAYRDYKDLLQYIAGIEHQSCLILTSREKPQGLDFLEGRDLPVRTLYLDGLNTTASRRIIEHKGLNVSDQNLIYLVTYYRGNPMALKIISTAILEIFDGNAAQFLQQTSGVFSGIYSVLREQLQRLSQLEKTVLYWLAINYAPASIAQLQSDIIDPLEPGALVEALESLRRRSLIEVSTANRQGTVAYTLQPVVMEFVLQSYVQALCTEITSQTPQLLRDYALLKTNAGDSVREAQKSLILGPLTERLQLEYPSHDALVLALRQVIDGLKQTPSKKKEYAAGNILNLCWSLQTPLTSDDYSHLYIRQAVLDRLELKDVNFSGCTFSDCLFAHSFGGITNIAFSPDKETFATCDTNGVVSIWSLTTMQPYVQCKGHDFWTWSIAFHPSKALLASCGNDRKIYLWDVNTGHCLNALQGHTSIAVDVAFSPDGLHVMSCSNDKTLKFWDLETGRCVYSLEGHDKPVWSMAFTADSQNLFSAGEDCCIRYWDLQTGNCLNIVQAHEHWVMSISLSPDERHLASASLDGTIKIWDAKTLRCLQTLAAHPAPVMSVAFSPDGKHLASGSYDQTVRLYSLSTGHCTRILRQHTNRIWAIAFHPDGTLLASGGDDNSTRFWHLPTGELHHTLQGYSNAIYDISVTQNGRLVASAHEDQTIRIWSCLEQDTATISSTYTTLSGHQNRVFSIEFSPDARQLASSSFDRLIKLWDVNSLDCIMTLTGHESWIWDISFHPSGKLLASASYDCTVRLWDIEQGRCAHVLSGHERSAHCVAFNQDGMLASGGYDAKINLWHPASGELCHSWSAHQNRIWDITFSPDGQVLASAGEDRLIMLWDSRSGQQLHVLSGHRADVLSLAFSADGQYLFSSSADQTIKQWNVATGHCLKTINDHQGWVWSVVCLADQMISCSQDETICRWSRLDNRLEQTLSVPRPYNGMNITGAKGLTYAQYQALKVLGAIDHAT